MIREKKVFVFKIRDIWFEKKRFLEEKYPLMALHSNEDLAEPAYDFKLTAYTFVLNIGIPVDEIFKKFDYKSARYPINRGIRDGILVKKAETEEEIKQYHSFQKEFCEKKKIPVCSCEELAMLDCYYAVSKAGEYLGGCAFLISEEENTARYKFGATLHKMNANEMILWKAICDYHDAGIQWFDMGGVTPTEDKDSYYYRHYQFKKKFGGKLTESYIYFKVRGIYRIFYYIFKGILKLFFRDDLNEFTNFLNRMHVIR